MTKTQENVQKFLEAARKHFGETSSVRVKELEEFSVKSKLKFPYSWLRANAFVSRGIFTLSATHEVRQPTSAAESSKPVDLSATAGNVLVMRPRPQMVKTTFDPNASSDHVYADVPEKNPAYVPFGMFSDIVKIATNKSFFPVFITGMSGNGKTLMVEQACAKAHVKLLRIQMSVETDEDDLIGGFRLINGETKFIKGPVVIAMEMGAALLIDEVDRADPNKIMCLQGILEGKPYYMKKTGEIIYPQPGFNIFVTANTKGRGSESGLYTAAKILDDSWLERFPITIEQEFPNTSIETKILVKYIESRGGDPRHPMLADFIKYLIEWGQIIRKTFADDGADEVISTRRLVHIIQTFLIFNDKQTAIKLCLARYDEDTKTSFLEVYSKVDPTLNPAAAAAAPVVDLDKRFVVSLVSFPRHTKIQVIKAVRELGEFSLIDAKNLIESIESGTNTVVVVKKHATKEEADVFKFAIESVGGVISAI